MSAPHVLRLTSPNDAGSNVTTFAPGWLHLEIPTGEAKITPGQLVDYSNMHAQITLDTPI
jgi:hypothetical protein